MLARMTFADILRPKGKESALVYNAVLVLAGSFLIGVCAQISVPLFPVPVTLQTFAVLMIGALLGSKRGSLTVLVYLAQGAFGLPVFSLGRAGAAMLVGPTAGYLFGFVAAAFVVGFLAERGWDRKFWTTILAMTLGTMCIYGFGLAWLSCLMGLHKAVLVGFTPFVFGAVLKIFAAATILPAAWKFLSTSVKQKYL